MIYAYGTVRKSKKIWKDLVNDELLKGQFGMAAKMGGLTFLKCMANRLVYF